MQSLDAVRERLARRLVIDWTRNADDRRLLTLLGDQLKAARGGDCAVTVRYATEQAYASFSLGPEWNVRATAELLEQLQRAIGTVRVVYGPPGGATSVATG